MAEISSATIATNPASTVYWRRRKAIEPSRMAAMSSRMRSFPGSAALTCRAKRPANSKPPIAAAPAPATYQEFIDYLCCPSAQSSPVNAVRDRVCAHGAR